MNPETQPGNIETNQTSTEWDYLQAVPFAPDMEEVVPTPENISERQSETPVDGPEDAPIVAESELPDDVETQPSVGESIASAHAVMEEIAKLQTSLESNGFSSEELDSFGLVSLSETHGLEPTLSAICESYDTEINNYSDADRMIDRVWKSLIPDAEDRKSTYDTMISGKDPVRIDDAHVQFDENTNAELNLESTMRIDESGNAHIMDSGRKGLFGRTQERANLYRQALFESMSSVSRVMEAINDKNSSVFADFREKAAKDGKSIVSEIMGNIENPTMDDFIARIDEIVFEKSHEAAKQLDIERQNIDNSLESIDDQIMDEWWQAAKPVQSVRRNIEFQAASATDPDSKSFLESEIARFRAEEKSILEKYEGKSRAAQDEYLAENNLPTPDSLRDEAMRMRKVKKSPKSDWHSLNH